ncbi:reverse transcriptase domain-containing protein [Tanacetum coccineum]
MSAVTITADPCPTRAPLWQYTKVKFADKRGMEQVLERGPWLIRNTLLILNKWTPSLPLRNDEVTKVPVWVKLHKVALVAYSEDGLNLIATQIGKPLMLDAFTSTMCVEAWGRISFARALVEISSDTDLKKEVIMAVPNEDITNYTREVISVEYEWQPPRCADCKKIGHSDDKCPKIVREPVTCTTLIMNSDGFTEVKRKKNKGKKADQQPRARHIDGIRLTKPKPNFYWQKTGANKSGADLVNKGPTDANSSINKVNVDQAVGHATVSKHTSPTWNEDFESDDEVDEVIFSEGNKFDDQFDIRLKGRMNTVDRSPLNIRQIHVIPTRRTSRQIFNHSIDGILNAFVGLINHGVPLDPQAIELYPYLGLPIQEVSDALGVSVVLLNKRCQEQGIMWPRGSPPRRLLVAVQTSSRFKKLYLQEHKIIEKSAIKMDLELG